MSVNIKGLLYISFTILLVCSSVQPSSPTSSPLYLYGNTGTGKTLTIKTVLEAIKTPFVLINCVECFNSQVLYDTILRRVIGLCQGVRDRRKCGNLYMFVRELQQIVGGDEQLSKETLYIVSACVCVCSYVPL